MHEPMIPNDRSYFRIENYLKTGSTKKKFYRLGFITDGTEEL